jgi:ABC-type Zn uptake system ZnuABC Zn-binding protein ZnuA
MRRITLFLLPLLLALFCSCSTAYEKSDIAATTLPVYEFTARLCRGTDLGVTRLVTESVSCLHDYTLNVRQVKAAEAAEVIVISGAGLEEFMEDILHGKAVVDSASGMELQECAEAHHHDHDHHHPETDAHIWLSPANAKIMASNICQGLCVRYPEYEAVFQQNLKILLADLDALQAYGEENLKALSSRDLITFHDGFGYFADSFGLHILEAVEEESGSEASAQELKHLIGMVRDHDLKAIFIETNGSVSAAEVISRETGVPIYTLDMAMGGDSYFAAMYHNIDTIKEALS